MSEVSVVIRKLIHGKLYHLGDYYNIPGLCELALQRFNAKRRSSLIHGEYTGIRMAIASLLKAGLERLGICSQAENLLD
jgi:hypothetical protein